MVVEVITSVGAWKGRVKETRERADYEWTSVGWKEKWVIYSFYVLRCNGRKYKIVVSSR